MMSDASFHRCEWICVAPSARAVRQADGSACCGRGACGRRVADHLPHRLLHRGHPRHDEHAR
eukprot:2638126-Rhodomonas_salina.1